MAKIQVDVLGSSFSLEAAKETQESLERTLTYYKEIVSSIENATGVQDPLKISILAGMELVDELFKKIEKSLPTKDDEQAELIVNQLIERTSSVLEASESES